MSPSSRVVVCSSFSGGSPHCASALLVYPSGGCLATNAAPLSPDPGCGSCMSESKQNTDTAENEFGGSVVAARRDVQFAKLRLRRCVIDRAPIVPPPQNNGTVD